MKMKMKREVGKSYHIRKPGYNEHISIPSDFVRIRSPLIRYIEGRLYTPKFYELWMGYLKHVQTSISSYIQSQRLEQALRRVAASLLPVFDQSSTIQSPTSTLSSARTSTSK